MAESARSKTDVDVVVIGSGFGGSVSALRLAEKGYTVTVLEAGRRFKDDEFAKTSWRLRSYLWAPRLGCYGIQRIHFLKNVMILAGAGVGGGSLVYANTLYRPLPPFFADLQWAHITDWADELDPYYDQASRMLGVTPNPTMTPADKVIKKVADKMGVGDTFHATPVGVFFDKPGVESPDPFFGGAGPARTGCTECGACMSGCRVGAKNTLVKNYLYLAERAGVSVQPLTTVTGLKQLYDGTWEVSTARTGAWVRKRRSTIRAQHVVLAAGTWGTQNLLHRVKQRGDLPGLSDKLGELTRTNSEAIIGSGRLTIDKDNDYSFGTAITSSFHPDENTHIEPCRYGHGSNAMGLLQTVATDGSPGRSRVGQLLKTLVTQPKAALLLNLRHWSQRTMILLVMQTLDNSLTTYLKRGWTGRVKLTSRQGHGEPNPTFIKAGYDANALVAEEIGAIQGSTWNEMANIPTTAHFLGGCAIGDSPENGVVDAYHRAFGLPNLHIVDGSTVSANLGVNPSLTITAQAERAISFWPNRGEVDPRPALGAAYERLAPVAPKHPVVPESAPAALRLPFVSIEAVVRRTAEAPAAQN
ncbi:FAD-dependent oxidoreductase [Spongisporangium articulatum]|uniref:Cholesterol oxidase n=1 Tax=Spongisporangium articulatum TaxID=3362603 RepID=A0ABW8AQP8_9ACTN